MIYHSDNSDYNFVVPKQTKKKDLIRLDSDRTNSITGWSQQTQQTNICGKKLGFHQSNYLADNHIKNEPISNTSRTTPFGHTNPVIMKVLQQGPKQGRNEKMSSSHTSYRQKEED